MAVVLPIISAFSAISAAGGIGAALTAGFSSFAAVAGGFMAGAGILTGNKSLQKLGGLMSLAGGVSSMLGSAGSAAEGASAAWDGAGSAAGSDAAQFGKYASDAGGLAEAGAAAGDSLSMLAPPGGSLGTSPFIDPTGAADATQSLVPQLEGGGLMEQARLARTPVGGLLDTQSGALAQPMGGPLNALQEAASQIKSADHMQSLLGRLGNVGKFVKDNKELVSLAGSALSSVYDPQREQFDWQRNLMAQRRNNLNSPVSLINNPTPKVQGG